eukprot:TRINITY_DN2986_c0_g3_i1.p1 TRINITY_DN2986_c0_g3~~TRINITY_DN2986_c0_g3_i1.p1  ORF type:complete len:1306 (-),score=247.99 TRINITY_DN2986_c0_g3_i1:1773-5690(-)
MENAASPWVHYFCVVGFKPAAVPTPPTLPPPMSLTSSDHQQHQQHHHNKHESDESLTTTSSGYGSDEEESDEKATVPVPVVLQRFPQEDYPSYPLPEQVATFCFPEWDDTQMTAAYQVPMLFNFALTGLDGAKYHCVCLTIPESLCAWSPPAFGPKAVCLISSFPALTPMTAVLEELYRITCCGEGSTLPLERILAHAVLDVPLPPLGCEVRFQVRQRVISCRRPAFDEFPIADFPLRTLFDCIGISNVVRVFESVLYEQKIIFHSRQRTLLANACDSICTLMYPFQWHHVFIPFLPASLLDFLQAPTPYIVGVITDKLFSDQQIDLTGVVVVDLDGGEVTRTDDLAEEVIPIANKKDLVERLRLVLAPQLLQADWAFTALTPIPRKSATTTTTTTTLIPTTTPTTATTTTTIPAPLTKSSSSAGDLTTATPDAGLQLASLSHPIASRIARNSRTVRGVSADTPEVTPTPWEEVRIGVRARTSTVSSGPTSSSTTTTTSGSALSGSGGKKPVSSLSSSSHIPSKLKTTAGAKTASNSPSSAGVKRSINAVPSEYANINAELLGEQNVLNIRIRACFLLFFIPMFRNYRRFVAVLRRFPKPIFIFDKAKFLEKRSPEERSFLVTFLASQGFSFFLDTHHLAENRDLFHKAVNWYDISLRSKELVIKHDANQATGADSTLADPTLPKVISSQPNMTKRGGFLLKQTAMSTSYTDMLAHHDRDATAVGNEPSATATTHVVDYDPVLKMLKDLTDFLLVDHQASNTTTYLTTVTPPVSVVMGTYTTTKQQYLGFPELQPSLFTRPGKGWEATAGRFTTAVKTAVKKEDNIRAARKTFVRTKSTRTNIAFGSMEAEATRKFVLQCTNSLFHISSSSTGSGMREGSTNPSAVGGAASILTTSSSNVPSSAATPPMSPTNGAHQPQNPSSSPESSHAPSPQASPHSSLGASTNSLMSSSANVVPGTPRLVSNQQSIEGTLESKSILLLNDLFKLDYGRMLFVEIVREALNGKWSVRVEDMAFEMLASLFHTLVWEAHAAGDFFSPLVTLEIAGAVYHMKKDSLDQEFLADRLIGQEMWTNNHFWETALFDSITIARDSLPGVYRTVNWEDMDEAQASAAMQAEEDIIFKVVTTFLKHMLNVCIATDDAFHFIEKVHTLTRLENHSLSTFRSLLQNMEASKKQGMGSSERPPIGTALYPGTMVRNTCTSEDKKHKVPKKKVRDVFKKKNKMRTIDGGSHALDRIQYKLDYYTVSAGPKTDSVFQLKALYQRLQEDEQSGDEGGWRKGVISSTVDPSRRERYVCSSFFFVFLNF